MSKRWKCVCGKESPLSEQRCPYCKRPLGMYGAFVTDEQEPEIPYRPYTGGGEQGGTGQPPEGPKKRGGAALVILIVLLILVILILGALVMILLGREAEQNPAPTQPPVMQTTPVDVPTDPTAPADTQPVQTDPPATNPPATQPPATEPPETQPPVTEPPATEPPATEPPATEPIQVSNFLKATIYGEEIIFQLNSASVGSADVRASYRAYNPRGEARYYISLRFNKNYTVGTYNTTGSILYTEVDVSFMDYAVNRNEYYNSYRKHGDKTDVTGTFVIEKMSDDWMTYDGSFNVKLVLYGTKESIVIDDAVFNFTIQETP